MNNLSVSCYSGYTYAESPRSFRWGGRQYKVEEIESAWQEPAERCFLVLTRDNYHFKLCYNETEKQWWLVELPGVKQCKKKF